MVPPADQVPPRSRQVWHPRVPPIVSKPNPAPRAGAGSVVEYSGDTVSGWSVECRDQFADRWPRVRCRWQGEVAKVAGAPDDGVGAELTYVLGRPLEPTAGSKEPRVHPDGARRPHLAIGASFGAEQSIERPVGVGDDVERELEVLTVCGEAFGGREGDDGNPGVTELVEVIAHGDHVFLAGQSSQVPVQDQHKRPAAHLGGTPRCTLVIDEFDVGEQVADVNGPGGVHTAAHLRPRLNADCSMASTSRSIEPSHASSSVASSSTM